MDKKEFTISVIIIGLTALFAVASFALFLSRGKSQFWTAKKMKLGALLLTFTALTSLTSCNGKNDNENIRVSCYEMVVRKDIIYIENYKENINLKESYVLKGIIEYRSSEIFSYSLTNDADSTIKIHKLLQAKDGAFDNSTEQFSIKPDKNLIPGKYTLSFYDTGLDSIGWSIADYHFNIKND